MEKPLNLCIIHFNTPELTECLIKSINKFTPNSKIYVFDNSDKSPFTYRQENIIYIDNTNGQVINFEEWIKTFKNRSKTGVPVQNKFASAKHCYSVQKCIELIDENFILLDSDILLKRDISDLYDTNYLWIGGTEVNKGKKTRVLPYLLFINVEQCKKENISFFNKDYMHGLSTTGFMYDTGSYFYYQTEKKNYKVINYKDYIVHYKAGSWVAEAKKYNNYKQVPIKTWLNTYRKYWRDETINNKVVIYTAITGGYDSLLTQKFINDNIDYVCFTDDLNMESGVFELRPIPEELKNLSLVKQQRCLKVNPHKYLSEYDISVWIDGNVEVLGNPLDLINDEDCIFIPKHPRRNCLYNEGNECIRLRKDTSESVNTQLKRYKKEGFPKNYGLPQSNIIIRRHNDPRCIKLMETWWQEIENGSHRDQLSFSYAAWKNQDVHINYLDKHICDSPYFYWKSGHSKSAIYGTGRISARSIIINARNSQRVQIPRPNKVHIEASWNPLETHPKKTVVKDSVPINQVKNNKGNVIHIKRLFY